MKEGQTPKKILTIISNVILYTFVLISVLGVFLTITAKQGRDGTATVFGMQMRYVLSSSMEESEFTNTDDFDIKDIPAKSMVFVRVVPSDPEEAYEWYSDLDDGDVLTFRYVYTTQETITHRIVHIEEKKDKSGFIIELEGDNKSSEMGTLTQIIDTSLVNSPNYVIGKVVGQSRVLGFFTGILKSPAGLILAVILPCTLILIFEIFRIVNVVGLEKRQQAEKERSEKQQELDDLRRRLAELESQNTKKSTPPEARSTDEDGHVD